jgi:hypothetical protein
VCVRPHGARGDRRRRGLRRRQCDAHDGGCLSQGGAPDLHSRNLLPGACSLTVCTLHLFTPYSQVGGKSKLEQVMMREVPRVDRASPPLVLPCVHCVHHPWSLHVYSPSLVPSMCSTIPGPSGCSRPLSLHVPTLVGDHDGLGRRRSV